MYSDHLNILRRVVTNDSENKIIWSWESKPFGESKPNEDPDKDNTTFTLNLRFPGQYYDKETNTHYNINRDYNPLTGRYIQSDPIGFDGGINTYLYANANPLSEYDLFGLISRKEIIQKNLSGYNWSLKPNWVADGSKPWYELASQSMVKEYETEINIAAGRFSINPNIIKAIMYIETTHGWYDAPLSWFGANKSILPMNINVVYWGNTFGSRDDLLNPFKNILAGADLIHRIKKNMLYPYSIRQLATLYNNINANQVNDYGARVEKIYYEQTWDNY